MTSFILTRKIKELERIDKTKGVFRVQIEKAKSTIKKENLPLPADTDDHKFFEAAIACSARYIITTDHSSLDLDPYDHNLMHMRIVKPVQYTAENCQSDLPS
jgi:predicted nucleic acid-binding protein